MTPFTRLPGFTQSPPGLEHRIWRRLRAVLLWGTLLPLLLACVLHALAAAGPMSGAADRALRQWDYTMLGVITLHWSLVLTLGLGCLIVRVMKGPAYVADAYALPLAADDGGGREQPAGTAESTR
jgi:hypothetical protein